MEASELIEIISRGEDGKHQFKEDVTNSDSLAAEMVAFSNSGGGLILIGVDDDGNTPGLSTSDVGRLNKLVSNTASQSVRPPVNPRTENIKIGDRIIMVVSISDGISKPYMDNGGLIWVKNGADKRKVTSREEMQRMFQSASLIHGDEIPANGLTVADIDLEYFRKFFESETGESLEKQENSLPLLLENMNLSKNGILNIAGALLFAKNPQYRLPVFIVKAVCYKGNEIGDSKYIDSIDIQGKISDVYRQSMSFIYRNIRQTQSDKGVNSLGSSEIPDIVFEELLVNALIHRDYFISSPIRIFIFDNRIEIVSPGHLPNNLTIQNIKNGNSNIRNPILASFATKLLPYRGLGNGIRRAIKGYPNIDFIDDRDGNQFKVIINRD